MTADELNSLAKRVLDAAFAVHKQIGPGLLESTYKACMLYELEKRSIQAVAEVAVPVRYDGRKMADIGYRMDVLVERELVLELKAVEAVTPIHRAQLLSYLKHSGHRLGLLINFHEPYLKDGLVRLVNGL